MTTYVTFGQDHKHVIDGVTFDKNCVALFYSNTEKQGHDKAFKYFGTKFYCDYFKYPPDMSHFPTGFVRVPEKLKCGTCTHCCKSGIPFIPVLASDTYNYDTVDLKGVTVLRFTDNQCVYLKNGCSIYNNRPTVCKKFDCRDFQLIEGIDDVFRYKIKQAIDRE